VLHLPTIVESAVASPAAAQAAANQIRKFLSKENYSRPHVQYNAVMLIRILADNPGPSFTKNMDKQFADTIKHLLRNGQDPSVAQILRETLDALYKDKAHDTNLSVVFAMWKKEQELMANAVKGRPLRGPLSFSVPPWQPDGAGTFPAGEFGSGRHGSGGGRGLPTPVELAARIEEARTSAKLLLQLVQSTPPHELLGNELVKEFSERCMSAQRSVQGYINCDNPSPDDDTMLTLIETNEQLSLAASKHQRAVLQARRAVGASPSPPVPTNNYSALPSGPTPPGTYASAPAPMGPYAPPPQLPPREKTPMLPPLGLESEDQSPNPAISKKDDLPLPPALQAGPNRQRTSSPPAPVDDPFADHYSSGYAAAPAPAPAPPVNREQDYNPSNGYKPFSQGYQSTPSYMGRQESSANNLTMHGGQRDMTEEEEYARDYPAGAGAPKSPEDESRARLESDVSPMTDHGTVTYRY